MNPVEWVLLASALGYLAFLSGTTVLDIIGLLIKGRDMTAIPKQLVSELYEMRHAYDREDFARMAYRIIEKNGEITVPEPKTALAHAKGWGRRVGTILGLGGTAAALVVGDILTWQNLTWIDGVGVTLGAVGVVAGTIWYVVDEYNER